MKSPVLIVVIVVFGPTLGLKAQTQLWAPGGTVGNNTINSNIGVGTATPGATLQVNGGGATVAVTDSNTAGGTIRLGTTTGSNGQWAYDGSANTYFDFAQTFRLRSLTGGTNERLTLLSNGNVGIGAPIPSTKLQVVGAITSHQQIINTGSATNVYVAFTNNGVSRWTTSMGGAETGSNTGSDFQFSNYNDAGVQMSVPLTIQRTTGNVGIGTPNPSAKFHLLSGTPVALIEHNSGQADVMLRSASGPWNYTRLRNQNSKSELGGSYDLHLVADVNATPTYAGGAFIESNNTMAEYSSTAGNKSILTVQMDADGTPQKLLVVRGDSGNVGIGTANPGTYKLAVNGTVRAMEVIVDTGWSDYVFAPDYALAPLSEVEAHIKEHQHLPGIPSASEVAEHGVSVGEMQAKLLAKIEELTLHVIAQGRDLSDLKSQNHNLRTRVAELETVHQP